MKYNIESAIKRLQEANKAGKTLVDEEELIRIATPDIDFIDSTIEAIKNVEQELIYYFGNAKCSTKYLAEKTKFIKTRETYQQWKKQGIINYIPKKQEIDITELLKTLELIKERKKV